jgi:hypothetical protein
MMTPALELGTIVIGAWPSFLVWILLLYCNKYSSVIKKNYVDKMRGQKMPVLAHAQVIKNVHAKWQNFAHVFVECPQTRKRGVVVSHK